MKSTYLLGNTRLLWNYGSEGSRFNSWWVHQPSLCAAEARLGHRSLQPKTGFVEHPLYLRLASQLSLPHPQQGCSLNHLDDDRLRRTSIKATVGDPAFPIALRFSILFFPSEVLLRRLPLVSLGGWAVFPANAAFVGPGFSALYSNCAGGLARPQEF